MFFVLNGLKKIAFRKEVKKLKESGVDTQHLQKKEVDLGSTRYAINNTLFLLSIFNGWFVMITIYGIGYYSNQHCGVSDKLLLPFYYFGNKIEREIGQKIENSLLLLIRTVEI